MKYDFRALAQCFGQARRYTDTNTCTHTHMRACGYVKPLMIILKKMHVGKHVVQTINKHTSSQKICSKRIYPNAIQNHGNINISDIWEHSTDFVTVIMIIQSSATTNLPLLIAKWEQSPVQARNVSFSVKCAMPIMSHTRTHSVSVWLLLTQY